MRRPDAARVREAQRAGIRARMIGEYRMSEARADELLARWDAEAAAAGVTPDAEHYRSRLADWLAAWIERSRKVQDGGSRRPG